MYGHDTTRPCDVCGEVKDNKLDTWFNYVTCSDHYDIPPTYARKVN